jgi:hypothetical protein
MLKLKTLAVAITIALVALVVPTAAPASADTPTLPQCATIDSLNCTGTFTNIRRGDGLFIQSVNGHVTTGYDWPFPSATETTVIQDCENQHAQAEAENAAMADTIWDYQKQSAQDDEIYRWQVRKIDRQAHRISKQQRTIRHLRALLAKAEAR